MFTKNRDVYIIDHSEGGLYLYCFMTFVAHQPDTVSRYLRNPLRLRDRNLDILECAASNFSPLEGEMGSDQPTGSESEVEIQGEALVAAEEAFSEKSCSGELRDAISMLFDAPA